jgi:hypothetical protein
MKIEDYLDDEVRELYEKALELQIIYMKKLNEICKDKNEKSEFNEEEQKIINNMTFLDCVKICGSYEKVDISEKRELTAIVNKKNRDLIDEIIPTGKEIAKIELWTGMEKFKENF